MRFELKDKLTPKNIIIAIILLVLLVALVLFLVLRDDKNTVDDNNPISSDTTNQVSNTDIVDDNIDTTPNEINDTEAELTVGEQSQDESNNNDDTSPSDSIAVDVIDSHTGIPVDEVDPGDSQTTVDVVVLAKPYISVIQIPDEIVIDGQNTVIVIVKASIHNLPKEAEIVFTKIAKGCPFDYADNSLLLQNEARFKNSDIGDNCLIIFEAKGVTKTFRVSSHIIVSNNDEDNNGDNNNRNGSSTTKTPTPTPLVVTISTSQSVISNQLVIRAESDSSGTWTHVILNTGDTCDATAFTGSPISGNIINIGFSKKSTYLNKIICFKIKPPGEAVYEDVAIDNNLLNSLTRGTAPVIPPVVPPINDIVINQVVGSNVITITASSVSHTAGTWMHLVLDSASDCTISAFSSSSPVSGNIKSIAEANKASFNSKYICFQLIDGNSSGIKVAQININLFDNIFVSAASIEALTYIIVSSKEISNDAFVDARVIWPSRPSSGEQQDIRQRINSNIYYKDYWQYLIIDASVSCNAALFVNNANVVIPDIVIRLQKSNKDNYINKKFCFKVTYDDYIYVDDYPIDITVFNPKLLVGVDKPASGNTFTIYAWTSNVDEIDYENGEDPKYAAGGQAHRYGITKSVDSQCPGDMSTLLTQVKFNKGTIGNGCSVTFTFSYGGTTLTKTISASQLNQ